MLLVQVLPALALVNAGLLANAAPIVSVSTFSPSSPKRTRQGLETYHSFYPSSVQEKHVAVVDKREPLHPALWVGLTVGSWVELWCFHILNLEVSSLKPDHLGCFYLPKSVIKGLARSKEAEDEFLAELSSIETRDFEAGEGMEKRLIAAIGSRLAHGIMNSGSIGSAVTKVANVFNKFRSRSLSDSEEALEIERRLASWVEPFSLSSLVVIPLCWLRKCILYSRLSFLFSALDEAFESKEAVDELLAELSSIDAGDFEDDEGMAKRLTYSQDRKNRLVNFILKRPSIRKPLAKIIDTFKSRSLNDPEEGFEKRIASWAGLCSRTVLGTQPSPPSLIKRAPLLSSPCRSSSVPSPTPSKAEKPKMNSRLSSLPSRPETFKTKIWREG